MSIIITNVSEEHGVPYGSGLQHYELKINRKLMAEFTHTFEDGLSECLRRAADAFEEQERFHCLQHIYNLLEIDFNDKSNKKPTS